MYPLMAGFTLVFIFIHVLKLSNVIISVVLFDNDVVIVDVT